MADNQKNTDLIHNLIECCRDSQQAYLEAAEHINDTRLRHYFNERSLERAQFAGELSDRLRAFGEHDLKTEGTTSGAIRRAWMDMKSKIGAGDHGILTSLEACEDNIKHAYQEAAEAGMPAELSSIIRSQAQSIFVSHDYIRNIRDRKAAA